MDAWARIWNRMTVEERRLGVQEYLRQAEKIPEAHRCAMEFIAQVCRTRPETVERWGRERQADRLVRELSWSDAFSSYIATFLLKHRAPMLARFLDAAEIPHLNGAVDPRTVTQEWPAARLVAGVRAISAEFEDRDVELYLDALEAQATPVFRNLPQARREARAAPKPPPIPIAWTQPALPEASSAPVAPAQAPPPAAVAVPTPPSPPIVPAPTPRDEGRSAEGAAPAPESPAAAHGALGVSAVDLTRPMPPPTRQEGLALQGEDDLMIAEAERFTPLDELLQAAAVAAVERVEGALGIDKVRGAAEELAAASATRHRSAFHLGFVDAVQGRSSDLSRASERRRGWYLSGVVHAHMRRGDAAAAVAAFDEAAADGRRLLGDRHEACGVTVGPLFEALRACGRRAEAVAAMVPSAVARGGHALQEALLAEAGGLLARSKAAEAMPVLVLLHDGIEAARRRRTPARKDLVCSAVLAHALAFRLTGAFDLARAALESVADAGDADLAARARADLGLVRCRVRSLAEVRLPARAEDLASTARALAEGEADFAAASCDANRRRAQPDYCLGVLGLARGDGTGALPALERACAALAGGGGVPEGPGVADRARLYRALALAESLDPARAEEAAAGLEASARALGQETPPWVLGRALTALSASRPEAAHRAVHGLHDAMGDRLLDPAVEAGLLRGHEPLRELLALRCEDAGRRRGARGADALALLSESLAANDVRRAERALEALESLADDEEGRARMLGVLERRDRYDPAWSAEEALDARVRLLEAEGRYAEAAALLCRAGHEALAGDPDRGLGAAEGILDRIAGYGVEVPDPAFLARLEALRRVGAPSAPPAGEPEGAVYFVGGNEVQERYEPWLREEAARRWPRVALHFDFTGWSGHWGRGVPAIEGRIAAAHAVVVMRFIRTMLGRTVRALCGRHGRPWVACTGHGRESLLSAIGRAVALLPVVR